MSEREGLVVVIPRGFDTARVPSILEEKRPWIEQAWMRVERYREKLRVDPPRLPAVMVLPGVGEEWRVEYTPPRNGAAPRVSVRSPAVGRLLVQGGTADPEACRQALLRWLKRRARTAFIARLQALAGEHGLEFERVSVRMQRSRWGSCSRLGTISLNLRLLFLQPDLLDYVLLHELCHTVEMNHSGRFWRRLESSLPGARSYRHRLRTAGDAVPTWVDHPLDQST